MTGHTSHGVLVGLVTGVAWEDIYLWVVGYHALVHAIESQFATIRAPEGTLVDTEFITMHTLTVHNLSAAVCAQLVLLTGTIHHIQLVVLHIGCGTRGGVPVVGLLSGYAVLPDYLLGLEVEQYHRLPVTQLHDRLVGVGESGVHQVAHVLGIITACPLVDVVECKQQGFLTCLGVDGVAGLYILLYQLLAPPCQPHVLWTQVGIVVTAEVQVFECKQFLILSAHGCGSHHHGQCGHHQFNLHHHQISFSFQSPCLC